MANRRIDSNTKAKSTLNDSAKLQRIVPDVISMHKNCTHNIDMFLFYFILITVLQLSIIAKYSHMLSNSVYYKYMCIYTLYYTRIINVYNIHNVYIHLG